MIRGLMALLLITTCLFAQYTLPEATLLPTNTFISSTPINCGSLVYTQVQITPRIVEVIPNLTLPEDYDSWSYENQALYLEPYFMAVFNLTYYIPFWEDIASVTAMRDYHCLPCPSDVHSTCEMTAYANIVWPPVSYTFTAGQVGANVFVTVDFVINANVTVFCDTKDGCR